jgi:arylsulfatase A-like enzyme
MIQLVEYAIPAGLVATHGSPYDYDRHVPILILVPGSGPGRVAEPVGVVDLAPTLAGILGLETPKVDGTDRSELLTRTVAGFRRRPAYAPPAPAT